MKKKTNWSALAARLVVVPVYMYYGLSMIISVYNMEFSLNPMEWNVVIRTCFASVIVVIYGLVLAGYISGNFTIKEKQDEWQ